MAKFGLTPQGFILKRLNDILTDQRQKAQEIFQDLVEPGEVVDVSDSSLLGRLISLDSPGDADLWEVAALINAAFDPNSATGIALDNLVAIGGLTRKGESFTTSPVILAGTVNTIIPVNSEVEAKVSGNKFTTGQITQLNPSQASGATFVVGVVENSTQYRITYTTNTSTQNITYTSDADATVAEILNGLKDAVVSGHPLYTASVVGTTLVLDKVDVFQTVNFTVSANLGVTKVRKIVDVVCTEAGVKEQLPNTITTINTPVLGWDSVTNPVAAVPGRLEETDEELRIRFRNSKFERASNIIEALYSALLAINGVTEVIIYENDTDVVDANGVQPHSFLPLVVGGTANNIGLAIWQNKPTGILSQGNTTVTILDSKGFPHDVSFERPNPVVIYIEMTLTVDGQYPANGDAAIKTAIVDYFNSAVGIGDDVVYSRLFTPINSVAGHQVDSLFIGTTASPTGTVNIPIAFNQIASINDVNIVINR